MSRYSSLAKGPDLDIVNTRQMSLAPEHPEEFHMMDGMKQQKKQFLLVYTGEAFQEEVNYPVLVEAWDKKGFGRHQRAWFREFTPAERKKIGSYYARFYRWYLVSGTPDHVSCKIDTLRLLQRAVNFFASF